MQPTYFFAFFRCLSPGYAREVSHILIAVKTASYSGDPDPYEPLLYCLSQDVSAKALAVEKAIRGEFYNRCAGSIAQFRDLQLTSLKRLELDIWCKSTLSGYTYAGQENLENKNNADSNLKMLKLSTWQTMQDEAVRGEWWTRPLFI